MFESCKNAVKPCRAARFAFLAAVAMAWLAPATGQAQRPRLDPAVLEGMPLQSRNQVMAMALRFAPGPEGYIFFIVDPQEVDENAASGVRPGVHGIYIFSPDHPDFRTPQNLRGRQENNVFSFSNLRLATRHEGVDVELVLEGNLRMWMGRYLETDPLTLRTRLQVSGRMTMQRPPSGRSRFMVSQNCYLSRFRGGAVSYHDFTAAPTLDFRLMEGGRLAVANLTLGSASGRADYWTYFFPLQSAESQIRVDAMDERGAVIETLQLRNQRGSYAELDSWTGRFRRLQAGQRYAVRASVDLGMLGTLEETIPVTVFEY